MLGEQDGKPVTVKSGRFGMYLNWKKVNAKMPPEFIDDPGSLPFDDAWALIEEKAKSMPSKGTASKRGSAQSVELPPAPKRPLSAYLHFCAEHRPKVAESGKSLGDVSKELAKMWAAATLDERKPYEDMNMISKKDYEEKKAAWEEECSALTKGAKGAKRKTNSSKGGSPKKPKSAYLYFCAAKRPEAAAKFQKLGDISKELARMWKEIGASDRRTYDELAAADKIRYEEEKLSGAKIDRPASSSTQKASPTKKRSKRSKNSGEKTKRAPSAYMLFCAANRPNIVDDQGNKLPLGETTKRLAELWKDADEQVRSEFEAESAKQKEARLAGSAA